MKAIMKRLALLGVAVTASSSIPQQTFIVPPKRLASAPYAPWAHNHAVWLSSPVSNQVNATAFVADWQAHNLTVGAYEIDSEWSTGINNFVVDTQKFPNITAMVESFHEQGIFVLAWMTSFVDTDSPNFNASLPFFIKSPFTNQTALLEWWHGTGALVDYTSPAAVTWWHAQLQVFLLQSQLDGLKADGSDPYILELLDPLTAAGQPISYREYADLYYEDCLNFSRLVRGNHSLIWSRPVDNYPLASNLTLLNRFSPPQVMHSGWVGDQDPTFAGLQDALINILESAWQNYSAFGSDTGGYREGNRTGEVLTRWAQTNAFLPLFENGGDGEHRPWMYEDDGAGGAIYTAEYQKLVAVHYELQPYLISTCTASWEGGYSAITPSGQAPAGFPLAPETLSDYSWKLGASYYIAPVTESNVTELTVTLPLSSSGSWYELWTPANVHAAGSSFLYPATITNSAVFVETGSILPLHVSTPQASLQGLGDDSWASALTVSVHTPVRGERKSFQLREWRADGGEAGAEMSYFWDSSSGSDSASEMSSSSSLCVNVTALDRDVIVLLRNTELLQGPQGLSVQQLQVSSSVAAEASADESGSLRGSSSSSLSSGLQWQPLPQSSSSPSFYATQADRSAFSAIDWDSAGPSPIYPVQGRKERLAALAAEQMGSWTYLPASESPTSVSELIIRVGSAAAGVAVCVQGLV